MLETHEFAPGRTILLPNGEEYQVADIITAGSGNDYLIVTQDRDLGPFTLLQAGHVRDTAFPVEPEEPKNGGPNADAQAEAERLRNEARQKEESAKAEKKARQKAKNKKGGGGKKKAKAKKGDTTQAPSGPTATTGATPAVPGPAAVSRK